MSLSMLRALQRSRRKQASSRLRDRFRGSRPKQASNSPGLLASDSRPWGREGEPGMSTATEARSGNLAVGKQAALGLRREGRLQPA